MADRGRTKGAARWILVSSLVGLLLLAPTAQAGRRLAGAKVGLTTAQSLAPVTGEIIGVRTDAIILETEQGDAETFAIKDIKSIRVYRRSQAVPGLVLGSLSGGGLGYLLSYTEYKDKFLGDIGIAFYTCLGLALGGLVGGVSGGSMGKDKIYDLTRMQAPEIDKLMAHLRKNARIPKYQ
ncbi:MAG: hypothetical protein WCC00_08080 [Candidatus Aminicenantales bacterium]